MVNLKDLITRKLFGRVEVRCVQCHKVYVVKKNWEPRVKQVNQNTEYLCSHHCVMNHLKRF